MLLDGKVAVIYGGGDPMLDQLAAGRQVIAAEFFARLVPIVAECIDKLPQDQRA